MTSDFETGNPHLQMLLMISHHFVVYIQRHPGGQYMQTRSTEAQNRSAEDSQAFHDAI